MTGRRRTGLMVPLMLALCLALVGCELPRIGGNHLGPNGTNIEVSCYGPIDIEYVTQDEHGITFILRSLDERIEVIPRTVSAEGTAYRLFKLGTPNPVTHYVVDGTEENPPLLKMAMDDIHEFHVSIDGVSDYTHFGMVFTVTAFDEDGDFCQWVELVTSITAE